MSLVLFTLYRQAPELARIHCCDSASIHVWQAHERMRVNQHMPGNVLMNQRKSSMALHSLVLVNVQTIPVICQLTLSLGVNPDLCKRSAKEPDLLVVNVGSLKVRFSHVAMHADYCESQGAYPQGQWREEAFW